MRTINASFSNTVQLGLPVVAALFGDAGLSVHVALISLHALILLSNATLLAELDLARAGAAQTALSRTLGLTLRRTLVHPVTLPVLLGLLWNVSGLPIPPTVDEIFSLLSRAMVPVCLVALGLSLSHYGLRGSVSTAAWIAAGKLLLQPLLVLVVGYVVLGLGGVTLSVIVMAAALPTGSNGLMFAQRYGTREAETTAVLVLGTLGFMVTAPLWLAVLHRLGGG